MPGPDAPSDAAGQIEETVRLPLVRRRWFLSADFRMSEVLEELAGQAADIEADGTQVSDASVQQDRHGRWLVTMHHTVD